MARSKARVPKMTKERESLMERIEAAEIYHKDQFVKPAEESMSLLRGKTSFMPSGFDKELDIIHPNMIFSTIRTYVPALYPNNPEVFVRPRGSEFASDTKRDHVFSAFIAQNVLNYYQKFLKMKKQDELSVLGGLTHGISYVMDAWTTELSHLNPEIVKDQPMHRFVSGIDLIPDPDGIDFEDKSFVVRIFGKRYDQMKRYGYKGLDDKNDDSNSGSDNGIDAVTKQPILPKFYEIWDKNTETVLIMSKENGIWNPHQERDFDIKDGFPFTPLIFNPMPDNFYPVSLVQSIKDMQKFITLMVSYGAKHAKMSVPKYVTWAEFLDSATKRALQSGKILDTIVLKRPKGAKETMGIDTAIGSLKQPGLPPDFYNMLNIVRDFLNTISGVSESARGGSQREETATGVAIVDSYLRSRIGDYKNIVDDWVAESRSKQLRLIRKNASGDNYLRFHEMEIEGQYFADHPEFKKDAIKKGQYFFVPWTKKDIDGEYDVEVGVGNGVPLNAESRYKKALQDYNISINNPILDKRVVTLDFLKEIGKSNPESWIAKPAPIPPEKPKVGVNVSVKAETLTPEILSQILTDSGLVQNIPTPVPGGPAGPGGSTQPGGQIRPVDAGLGRELGLGGGMPTPPKLPEVSGR